MTDTLLFYFKLGWEHIVSTDALDHQLFLLALVLPWSLSQFKKVLLLITAFTLGHCMTLALSSTGQVRVSPELVEFLIPLSIFITALSQFLFRQNSQSFLSLFSMAGIFGLVHGLGFANTLRMMLGKEDSLLFPLAGFNLGVEAGQVLVVALILGLKSLLNSFFQEAEIWFNRLILFAVGVGSIWLMWQRIPSGLIF
jgi:hypothetical protein